MNRHQVFLVVALGLMGSIPAFATDPNQQGGGWQTSSPETAASTLSGKLYRNSADASGAAPYVILDRWGVVRGYVAATNGVELESRLGQQVSLEGSIKTLPGGDMPCLTCRRILGPDAEIESTDSRAKPMTPRSESIDSAVRNRRPRTVAAEPPLPTRSDMAAEPVQNSARMPNSAALALHEVVLEPQSAEDVQDLRESPAYQADSRRVRRPAMQAANYQETLPTPAPATSASPMHRAPPAVADPQLEPTPMAEGPMVSEGPMMTEGAYVGPRGGCESCAAGGCEAPCGPSCNPCDDDPCWGPGRPLFCIGPTGLWVKADYLQWWEQGMHVPALVSTGGTAGEGIAGTSDYQTLFGDGYINNQTVSGCRIQAGVWLNRCETFGIEGEYLFLGDETTSYYKWSDGSGMNGNPILSRPFLDASTGLENVEIIAYPRGYLNSADGAINISAITHFHGAGAHFLLTTCRQEGCWTDDCCSATTYHDRFRADLIAGYRYLNLNDQLSITETITVTEPFQPTSPTSPGQNYLNAFYVHDQFDTQNSFNGGDLGMKFAFERNRWSLDLFPRIALGSTHSTADLSGFTRKTDQAGNETTMQGGLLVQYGAGLNGGSYTQNTFAVVPQLDVNLGYQFTTHTRLVIGYSGLYWSSVARAGEQIDRTVNSTLLPGAPSTGLAPGTATTARPQFSFQDTGFWAQGINVGVDCRW